MLKPLPVYALVANHAIVAAGKERQPLEDLMEDFPLADLCQAAEDTRSGRKRWLLLREAAGVALIAARAAA